MEREYIEQALKEKFQEEIYDLELFIPGIKLQQPIVDREVIIVPVQEGIKVFVYLNRLPDIETKIIEAIKKALGQKEANKIEENDEIEEMEELEETRLNNPEIVDETKKRKQDKKWEEDWEEEEEREEEEDELGLI